MLCCRACDKPKINLPLCDRVFIYGLDYFIFLVFIFLRLLYWTTIQFLVNHMTVRHVRFKQVMVFFFSFSTVSLFLKSESNGMMLLNCGILLRHFSTSSHYYAHQQVVDLFLWHFIPKWAKMHFRTIMCFRNKCESKTKSGWLGPRCNKYSCYRGVYDKTRIANFVFKKSWKDFVKNYLKKILQR